MLMMSFRFFIAALDKIIKDMFITFQNTSYHEIHVLGCIKHVLSTMLIKSRKTGISIY